MSCARTRRSVGQLRWTWQSTCSTACWSWDARTMSASPDPKRGWGHCARSPDPCNRVAPAAGPANLDPATALPRRILLVEDVELNRRLLQKMLSARGHEVIFATN